jgi:hypothetical protein
MPKGGKREGDEEQREGKKEGEEKGSPKKRGGGETRLRRR